MNSLTNEWRRTLFRKDAKLSSSFMRRRTKLTMWLPFEETSWYFPECLKYFTPSLLLIVPIFKIFFIYLNWSNFPVRFLLNHWCNNNRIMFSNWTFICAKIDTCSALYWIYQEFKGWYGMATVYACCGCSNRGMTLGLKLLDCICMLGYFRSSFFFRSQVSLLRS